MNYFILHTAVSEQEHFTTEFYIKGKSKRQVYNLIEQYSNGTIITSKFGICTRNIKYGFIREVQLNDYPDLSPKDFADIIERKCISF